ncbi:MarR family winged helix-turn-helix transcriptional regulator [Amycolatopsis pithecellobii]|uniref:MarR family transcriptional regulator n=1 Tax=Amycolatopsis pithecellobii TaxID=664692 RepID=A0A6N7ZBT2_9PSEU|nr:MarR family transcriptional regulator [Amycolatopsis pithecellobii]MTD59213.1 MarR family transcriptional regulator [Amycolatopsis pithecellobii]
MGTPKTEFRIDIEACAKQLPTSIAILVRRMRLEGDVPASFASVLGRLEIVGSMTATELSELEHVRHQSITQTVKALEAKGWVQITVNPDDRRQRLVSLAPAGRDILTDQRRRRSEWLMVQMDTLLTEQERTLLAAATPLLERLAMGGPAD